MENTKGKVSHDMPTPGKLDGMNIFKCDLANDEGDYIATVYGMGKNCEGNAELIAEAFNVTNECGLTPRKLLEQRNTLLELKESMKQAQEELMKASPNPLAAPDKNILTAIGILELAIETDAFNIASAAGLKLKQIFEQRNEMLKALKRCDNMFKHRKEVTGDCGNENLWYQVKKAIKKATP